MADPVYKIVESLDGSGGGGGGATDHGALTGLADDDHTQYHNDSRGDVRYYTKAQVDAIIAALPSGGGDEVLTWLGI
jgi:hypothetical protein